MVRRDGAQAGRAACIRADERGSDGAQAEDYYPPRATQKTTAASVSECPSRAAAAARHRELNCPAVAAPAVGPHLAGGQVMQPERRAQLVLGGCAAHVDLVAEHKEGDGAQVVGRQQRLRARSRAGGDEVGRQRRCGGRPRKGPIRLAAPARWAVRAGAPNCPPSQVRAAPAAPRCAQTGHPRFQPNAMPGERAASRMSAKGTLGGSRASRQYAVHRHPRHQRRHMRPPAFPCQQPCARWVPRSRRVPLTSSSFFASRNRSRSMASTRNTIASTCGK